jgi:repressor LexA
MRPTKQQKQMLDFITKYTAKHGISPSYREIAKELGYSSVSTVALHIDNLIERGYMIKRPHAARSLEAIGTDELAVLKRAQKAVRHTSARDTETIIHALMLMGFYNAAEKITAQSTAARANDNSYN